MASLPEHCEQPTASGSGASVPPQRLNTDDVAAIVAYHVDVLGRNGLSFEAIEALYTGSAPLNFRQLCEEPDLALTLERRFVPMAKLLSGNLYTKKDAYEKALHYAMDEAVQVKWRAQIARLEQHLPASGLENITFGLRQKWIPRAYIMDFLTDEGFHVGSLEGDDIYLMEWGRERDFAPHLQKYFAGQAITGSRKWEHLFRIETLETAFGQWMQGHPDIVALTELYNRQFNNYIRQDYSAAPLDIAEHLSGAITLHPHQNTEVRRLLDEGKGICAFAVGLGKTALALGLAACGIKRGQFSKVCVVVPQSVLGTWQQEAATLFSSHYLREMVRSPSTQKNLRDVAHELRQFQAMTQGLLILSKERFCSLPLHPETIDEFASYAGTYSRINKDLLHPNTDGVQELPFFEELGLDCLILDEAHLFKNSYEPTSRMKNIAYLATPMVSKNALNVAAKAHTIRSQRQGNGIFALTATPVTNSPCEIFNMLSLVCPVEEFSDMGIHTVEDIVTVFGRVKTIGTVRVSGSVTQREALLGFKNLDGLRNLFTRYVSLKNADDVSDTFRVPERHEHKERIVLSKDQQTRYNELRKTALTVETRRADTSGPSGVPGATDSFLTMLCIIREMDRLTLDIDFQERKTTVIFPAQAADNLALLLPLLPATCSQPTFNETKKAWESAVLPLQPECTTLPDGSVALRLPETFEASLVALLPEVGLREEDITHPLNPKYERLMVRAQEYFNQGGKQLVFTDEKSQHGKLRRLLARHLNIPLRCIAIINADEAAGSRIMRIEHAYNHGDVAIIIANRKAELGINLQNGTTAVHHLSLPWTPASIEQRNGRGVRQGNDNDRVDIHYYLGENTFDEYRSVIIQAKANWTNELLSGQGAVLDNPEAMDTEEMLDMLASDPEEAKARRVARKEAARKALEVKQQNALFNALRSLTVLHEKAHKKPSAKDKPETRTDATDTEQEAAQIAAQYAHQVRQTALYLRRAHEAGTLPFAIELLDELGQFAASPPPDNTILRLGDTFRVWNTNGFKCLRIKQLRCEKNQAVCTSYSSTSQADTVKHTLQFMAGAKPTTFDEFVLAHSWDYASLHTSGTFTKETFDPLARWMTFTPERGAVYTVAGGFHVAWSATGSLPASAVPVWPNPQAEPFRKALCQAYLKDRKSGRVNTTLMERLLGKDYPTIALAYDEGKEADLVRLMSSALAQAEQSGALDLDDPKELASKIEAFLRAQAGLRQTGKA